ncbi:MAG: DinB family protein [Flavisolibacter sp.]|nr:DinB family protein [Flavisolibacter sp.]
MARPDLLSIPPFYHNYINLVIHDNLHDAFHEHVTELVSLLSPLHADKWNFRYAEGKWTVKELVQHVIDAERIFNYRALCFARGDKNELPGFDENLYADNSKANNRKPDDLLYELASVQKSSKFLIDSFDDEQLNKEGISNNNIISVLAIGYITVGHAKHHAIILKERYL